MSAHTVLTVGWRIVESTPEEQALLEAHGGGHEAAIDVKPVPAIGAEIVLTVEASLGKRGGVPAAQAVGRRHHTSGTGGGR